MGVSGVSETMRTNLGILGKNIAVIYFKNFSLGFSSTVYWRYSEIQGMDFTTDKLRSLVRKWQSLIEAHVDVKTTDNYTLRLFCIAFTKKRPNQIKKTCYAQSSQIRQVRPNLSNFISGSLCMTFLLPLLLMHEILTCFVTNTWNINECYLGI